MITQKIIVERINKSNIEDNKIKKLSYFDHIWRSVICPGFGQYHLGKDIKALAIFSSFVTIGSFGLYYRNEALKTHDLYRIEKDEKKIYDYWDKYRTKHTTSNALFFAL